MNVFVTGGSGFVGTAVIQALLSRGHGVHALVNHRPLPIADDRVKSCPGGLFDTAALDAAMHDCAAVIHLVGIIKEKPSAGITFDRIHHQGTISIVEAAQRAGIKRYIQMSAIGASADSPAAYHRTKFAAEQYVRDSGLDWTIFRPSMILGPGGEFYKMEESWARGTSAPFFFMPYFGSGPLGLGQKFQIQPINVADVARAFAEALDKPETIGEIYPLAGPTAMTWPQMHQLLAEKFVGHRRAVIPIPAWYALALTHVVPSFLLPFSADQVRMSQQDNIADMTRFAGAFGWAPGAAI
jgi:NADH dehydrogenase